MTPARCISRIIIVTALSIPAWALGAQPSIEAHDPSPAQLRPQLRDALASFDRGSALLRTSPDEALTAFREARAGFQAVVDAGVENGWLYYNLGNTHLRLGDIGRAIAAYRRAERMMPDDQRVKANLQFARSLTRDYIEPSGRRALLQTVLFWHYSLGLRTRMVGAMVSYGVFWILLAAKALFPRQKLRYPLLACLVLWVPLTASVATDLSSRSGLTGGVLTTNDVVVRKGNGDSYEPQFKQPLHEGVEFEIVEQRGDWIHVEFVDGNRGWVRQREVELF